MCTPDCASQEKPAEPTEEKEPPAKEKPTTAKVSPIR
jgi:hypothetical protein